MRRSGNRSGKVNEEKEVDIEKSENSADICVSCIKYVKGRGKAFFPLFYGSVMFGSTKPNL